jgi:hypothetical protein
MRSRISRQSFDWLRQDVPLRLADFRAKRLHPFIVAEQQADPVELLYKAFRRLDAGQRRGVLLDLSCRDDRRTAGRRKRGSKAFLIGF